MTKNYVAVSGLIFGLIAVAQAARAFLALPVQVGAFTVPVGASWLAAVVAGTLCVWAFRSRG
jgi:hypothetical protein